MDTQLRNETIDYSAPIDTEHFKSVLERYPIGAPDPYI